MSGTPIRIGQEGAIIAVESVVPLEPSERRRGGAGNVKTVAWAPLWQANVWKVRQRSGRPVDTAGRACEAPRRTHDFCSGHSDAAPRPPSSPRAVRCRMGAPVNEPRRRFLTNLALWAAAATATAPWPLQPSRAASLDSLELLEPRSARYRQIETHPEDLPSAVDDSGRPRVIVDLARSLSPTARAVLSDRLLQIEERTGYRVRMLTQRRRTPGRAIQPYFGLDDPRSILIVLHELEGNVLHFRVGDEALRMLPNTFWLEMQGRYGNQFYVRDHGEEGALIACVDAIEQCLLSGKMCRFVPGFGRDQWALSFLMALLGGAVIGVTARTPRRGRRQAAVPNWRWVLVFSPLWGVFLISFGTLPIVAREGWLSTDLLANWGGAALAATAFWFAIPRVFPRGPGDSMQSEEE